MNSRLNPGTKPACTTYPPSGILLIFGCVKFCPLSIVIVIIAKESSLNDVTKFFDPSPITIMLLGSKLLKLQCSRHKICLPPPNFSHYVIKLVRKNLILNSLSLELALYFFFPNSSAQSLNKEFPRTLTNFGRNWSPLESLDPLQEILRTLKMRYQML